MAPVAIRDKLPVRAALFFSEAERDKAFPVSVALHLDTKLEPGAAFQDSLHLSLLPVFDRFVIVRTQPPPGAYDVILAPRITDVRIEASSWQGVKPGGKFFITGTLNVFDAKGESLLAATATGDGAAANLQDALGAGASQAVHALVRKLGEQLAVSPRFEQYAASLRPKAAPATAAVASDIVITFSHPGEAAQVTGETLNVVGLVTSPKGVQRVDLLVNGRPAPVSRDVRVQGDGAQSHSFSADVPLRAGQNVITVTAVDRSGAAAQAVRTVFRNAAGTAGTTVGAPARTGERWAVVIGIDQYRDPGISALRYATADAQAVFRFLTTNGGVKPANARLLINKDATQREIRQVLGDFLRQKALRDDEVIIYYAGHGTTEPDSSAEGGVAKYLVPWDADAQNLFSSAIPMEEIDRIFGRLSARKILMIQDTCFSGGAGGRTFLARGLTSRSTSLTDRFLQELTQKEGRMILTASDVNQVSQEDPALGHGIFTHFLLEALNGAADLDGDGAITVREVHLYLQRKVHERSNGVQTPQLYNVGDMIVVQKRR